MKNNKLNIIIDKVLNNVIISDVIGFYIDIKRKSSRDFIAICPFHDDKNPSLSISNKMQFYKCFSCNSSGNAINFVKNYLKISLNNAIKEIIKNFSLDINFFDYNDSKSNLIDLNVQKILKYSLSFFNNNLFLKENESFKNYLINNRNIDFNTITKFQIGYSNNSKVSLKEMLNKLKIYTISDLLKASIIKIIDNKTYDFFQNRIIFPIFNMENEIVGFSGRSLDKNSELKYLNSKSDLFHKNDNLYNINNALEDIRKKDYIIIVEGYMDVISLYRLGIFNVVASMGTSISINQIKLLKNLNVKKILLFFDGDNAGFNANIKNSSLLLKNKLECYIVNNHTKKDPDELANSDTDLLLKILKKPMNPIEFLINKFKNKLDQNSLLEQFLSNKTILLNSYRVYDWNKYLFFNSKVNDFLKNQNIDINFNYKENSKNLLKKPKTIKMIIGANAVRKNQINLLELRLANYYDQILQQICASREAYEIYRKKRLQIKTPNIDKIIFNKIINIVLNFYQQKKTNSKKNFNIKEYLTLNDSEDILVKKKLLKLDNNIKIKNISFNEEHINILMSKAFELGKQIGKLNNLI